jgi:hypothetical protein
MALDAVTFAAVRGKIPPIGGDLKDLVCPLGSDSFTALVANYGKRRRILHFWIWDLLLAAN